MVNKQNPIIIALITITKIKMTAARCRLLLLLA